MQTRKGRQIGQEYHVIFEKLPKVERGWATRGCCLPNAKPDSMRREGRHFSQSPASQSERGPLEGLGHHHSPRGRDRVTELLHNSESPWHPCPFLESGPKKGGGPRAEQTALQGPFREQPGPLPSMQPPRW